MKKLSYADLNQQQVVDIRSQADYQIGHLEHSLNLNMSNFKKYSLNFLKVDEPLVFITGAESETELAELLEIANEYGFNNVEGYLSIEAIPAEELKQTALISAKDFFTTNGEFILLDVRHPDEITRPAPETNLVNVPLEELAKSTDLLDPNKKIYTLCGSGNRGTTASSFLDDLGYQTTVIAGGMKAVEELQNKL